MIPELTNERSSAHQASRIQPVQRHLVIGTWAMSRQEPHLFFWRDHNSYDNDPHIIHSIEPGQEILAAARAAVIDSLIFAGTEKERAQKAIKDVQQGGAIMIWDSVYVEETANLVAFQRKASMVFVETIPSVLTELTKKDPHLLLSASALLPYSGWNSSLERRVELAFKKFVAQK